MLGRRGLPKQGKGDQFLLHLDRCGLLPLRRQPRITLHAVHGIRLVGVEQGSALRRPFTRPLFSPDGGRLLAVEQLPQLINDGHGQPYKK